MTFIPNPSFVDELSADPATQSCMEGFANTALEFAQAISPSKTFSERLSVQVDGDDIAVVSDWSLWAIIEYGSVNNPPYAPIRLGIEAAGLQLTDDGSTTQ
jgi:hypothetical protein